MGNESAKTLSPNELSDLKEQTTFSRTEIRDLYKKFTKDCPNGQMTVEEFKAMYETLFPEGDSGQFADHVFKAYDKDGNGVIDFQEFILTVSIASKGSIDEKLRWAFNMYDLDGNGYITKAEVHEMFKSIFKMRGEGSFVSMDGGSFSPEAAVEELFDHLDKNRDEKLSDIEFVLGAKQSPSVLGLLQPDL
ncbi:hypothetical protein CAPTEDRAFT_223245 [Capitella teleta]|uniref:EF-hand domain-containing protein n=1 Tax=Capitella teleta TaxID=283909 RepID=R7TX24_CAPTE|nr:hypothetical protein CAPTEDRAFT_223245 [Capitella teleta]|eukprot:ELT95991.1 hypothetical protein CAPTEDRAFT_223245 [Capitella teleta]